MHLIHTKKLTKMLVLGEVKIIVPPATPGPIHRFAIGIATGHEARPDQQDSRRFPSDQPRPVPPSSSTCTLYPRFLLCAYCSRPSVDSRQHLPLLLRSKSNPQQSIQNVHPAPTSQICSYHPNHRPSIDVLLLRLRREPTYLSFTALFTYIENCGMAGFRP